MSTISYEDYNLEEIDKLLIPSKNIFENFVIADSEFFKKLKAKEESILDMKKK